MQTTLDQVHDRHCQVVFGVAQDRLFVAISGDRFERVRAFYDFSPEEAGYVGWTMESGQACALRELKDGDLMMIYGASSGQTKKAMLSHVLGFVEIEVRPIRDDEKASEATLGTKF